MDKGLRRLIDAVSTSRLVYGEPVREEGRTVIPVARVQIAGGFGFGRAARQPKEPEPGTGNGGGGWIDARPAGFIELAPDGARFHEIPDPERGQRLLKSGAAAAATLLTAVAGARRLRAGGRRPAGLLGRGR